MKRRELRVTRGKNKYRLSTGEIVESLQSVGVFTDHAINIARGLEKHYRNDNKKTIRFETLQQKLSSIIAKEVGEEAAMRYRLQTPPFVPITVQSGDGEKVFSRRTLAASLEKLGLSFKDAHAVAQHIEQSLRNEGHETVSDRDLVHFTAFVLEARFGRDLRLQYEAQTNQPTEVQVKETNGVSFPYSRGILAQSLMAVGLGPELSHNFAKRVEDVLWEKELYEIARSDLRALVTSLLIEEAGEEFARRYELMRNVRRPDRPIVILIGGAPGVGKSTLASEIGYRLGIPRVVSTDSIRQALRSLISEELSPTLHSSSFSAWRAELLPVERDSAKPKRKRVIRGFQTQVQQLGPALTAIIERNIIEATSMVMEGIHLVPGISPQQNFENATVIELVVTVDDEASHKNNFSSREKQTLQLRASDTYLQHFEEIRILQEFIVKQAEEENVPVIEANDFDRMVDKAIEWILNAVLSDTADSLQVDNLLNEGVKPNANPVS